MSQADRDKSSVTDDAGNHVVLRLTFHNVGLWWRLRLAWKVVFYDGFILSSPEDGDVSG